MSDFIMGTILGKGFAQAQVHIVNSMSAEGTSAFDNMHECLSKPLFSLVLRLYNPKDSGIDLLIISKARNCSVIESKRNNIQF